MMCSSQRWAKALVQTDHEHDLSVPMLWSNVDPTSRNDLITHRRRNRGGQGGRSPPHFPGRGGRRKSPPPDFWGRTYLKIPPRFLFFHPHNSTVLTPDQSVRCFETFIGVGTGGAGDPAPPPVFLQCVCGGEGVAPHAGSPFGPVFQCPAI